MLVCFFCCWLLLSVPVQVIAVKDSSLSACSVLSVMWNATQLFAYLLIYCCFVAENIAVDDKPRRYPCPLCDKEFTQRGSLVIHQRSACCCCCYYQTLINASRCCFVTFQQFMVALQNILSYVYYYCWPTATSLLLLLLLLHSAVTTAADADNE